MELMYIYQPPTYLSLYQSHFKIELGVRDCLIWCIIKAEVQRDENEWMIFFENRSFYYIAEKGAEPTQCWSSSFMSLLDLTHGEMLQYIGCPFFDRPLSSPSLRSYTEVERSLVLLFLSLWHHRNGLYKKISTRGNKS